MARWLSRKPALPLKRSTLKKLSADQRSALEKWWVFGGGQDWFSTSANLPPWRGLTSSAGSLVTLQSAVGLPAVAAAIRLLAETTGMVPLLVYQGDPPDRDKARDSWQWYRLHEQPNDEQSAFDFFQDVETSVEATGNAFVWKAKTRPVVRDETDIQLFTLDPSRVRVKREEGKKVFKIQDGGSEKTYDARSVLHVRGWTAFPGQDQAPSPIALHREALGAAVARGEYESGFFTNNAQTSLAIVVPDHVPDDIAKEIVDRFVEQHTGANAYRPALVSGGGDIKQLTISQRDGQYIEQKQFSIEDTARIFHITAVGMLRQALGGGSSTKDDFERFLKVDLAPRLRRIEMAFRIDEDLFPRDEELFPEFLTDAVLRPDVQSRAAAYKDFIQAGIMVPDEIRERENLPPLPDDVGQIPQITPVGGAPNPPGQPSTNGGSNG